VVRSFDLETKQRATLFLEADTALFTMDETHVYFTDGKGVSRVSLSLAKPE
jgi:hypothetical protein